MDSKVNRLAILGSTGSIGQQTLQVVRQFPNRFPVVALGAGNNLALLQTQITEFKPQFFYYKSGTLKNKYDACFISIEEIAALPNVDTVMVATSGKASLLATISAAQSRKRIAIANKEPLVMAGAIITKEVQKHHAMLIPVDSEHSAIRQCLQGEKNKPTKIILTASGGPFRKYTQKQLKAVTPDQALQHPSWKMGRKVTIDSATLMNKGLEVIEAHWLFGVPIEDIQILVHPQSIVHSMVEFADGAVKAQLSSPDMRLPIQYALTYPERVNNEELPRIDWDTIKQLTFEQPDFQSFPCLKLAVEAGKTGGTMPTVLCAADEIAVDLFLKEKITFTDIAALVSDALEKHTGIANPDIEDILEADRWARTFTIKLAEKK